MADKRAPRQRMFVFINERLADKLSKITLMTRLGKQTIIIDSIRDYLEKYFVRNGNKIVFKRTWSSSGEEAGKKNDKKERIVLDVPMELYDDLKAISGVTKMNVRSLVVDGFEDYLERNFKVENKGVCVFSRTWTFNCSCLQS